MLALLPLLATASSNASAAAVATNDLPDGARMIAVTSLIVGGAVGLAAIIFGTIFYGNRERDREKTKRELAAYVAEGSLSADDAEMILRAKPKD